MNEQTLHKLHELETKFSNRFPGGFDNPEIVDRAKKHNVPRIQRIADESLGIEEFGNHNKVIESSIKIVTGSSMVSLFEKPRFRDGINALSGDSRHNYVDGLKDLLHGDEMRGFNQVLDILIEQKLAKWTLISAIPFYYRPTEKWFIKPTTTKNILKSFGRDDLVYKPRPSYDFYHEYSAFLAELKQHADPDLSRSNGAFTGFLMMATG